MSFCTCKEQSPAQVCFSEGGLLWRCRGVSWDRRGGRAGSLWKRVWKWSVLGYQVCLPVLLEGLLSLLFLGPVTHPSFLCWLDLFTLWRGNRMSTQGTILHFLTFNKFFFTLSFFFLGGGTWLVPLGQVGFPAPVSCGQIDGVTGCQHFSSKVVRIHRPKMVCGLTFLVKFKICSSRSQLKWEC